MFKKNAYSIYGEEAMNIQSTLLYSKAGIVLDKLYDNKVGKFEYREDLIQSILKDFKDEISLYPYSKLQEDMGKLELLNYKRYDFLNSALKSKACDEGELEDGFARCDIMNDCIKEINKSEFLSSSMNDSDYNFISEMIKIIFEKIGIDETKTEYFSESLNTDIFGNESLNELKKLFLKHLDRSKPGIRKFIKDEERYEEVKNQAYSLVEKFLEKEREYFHNIPPMLSVGEFELFFKPIYFDTTTYNSISAGDLDLANN